jgi:hypothetical protein
MGRVRTRRRVEGRGSTAKKNREFARQTILPRWGAPFEAQGEAVPACRRLAVPLQDLPWRDSLHGRFGLLRRVVLWRSRTRRS